jgi:hypothetical protein
MPRPVARVGSGVRRRTRREPVCVDEREQCFAGGGVVGDDQDTPVRKNSALLKNLPVNPVSSVVHSRISELRCPRLLALFVAERKKHRSVWQRLRKEQVAGIRRPAGR